jgi:hypothetical protein
MKKTLLLIGVVALSLIIAGTALGDMILDTGQAPDPAYAYGVTANTQWVAGRFTTDQLWNVGAMQGDIKTNHAGMVNVTIYTNGNNNLPGTALFTKSFQSEPDGFKGWQGTTGFAGTLAAGTYWIAFEPSTFQGGIGGYSWSAKTIPPSPMTLEAVNFVDGAGWRERSGDNRLFPGVRIESSPVPVPGAVLLLGSGLLRLANYRRRKLASSS